MFLPISIVFHRTVAIVCNHEQYNHFYLAKIIFLTALKIQIYSHFHRHYFTFTRIDLMVYLCIVYARNRNVLNQSE